jgi:hypothetical protein
VTNSDLMRFENELHQSITQTLISLSILCIRIWDPMNTYCQCYLFVGVLVSCGGAFLYVCVCLKQ